MTQGFSLAIDAMGGDNAPDIVLDGLELAAERHPDARFLLVGDEARLNDPDKHAAVAVRVDTTGFLQEFMHRLSVLAQATPVV